MPGAGATSTGGVRPKLGRPRVLLDIVEEHFDELDFLWEHREANVFTSDWTLGDLAEHEERAEAHLDGLRLAELHAVDLAAAKLSSGEPFAVTAAVLVLFEAGEAEFDELILQALRNGDPATVDGIRIALRHCAVARLESVLSKVAAGAESTSAIPAPAKDETMYTAAVAAADVLTFHRMGSGSWAKLQPPWFWAGDVWTRRCVLGITGRLGRLRDADVGMAMEHADPAVRLTALQEAARAGLPSVANHCRAAAVRGVEPDPEAVHFLGVLGDSKDLAFLQSVVRHPRLGKAAIAGLGAMGRVQSVPLLLELVSDKTLGVAANAAYRRITGATGIERAKPFPPPDEEGTEDGGSRETAEEKEEADALPPDPEKAKTDWRRRHSSMQADRVWQFGIPVDEGELPDRFDELPLEFRRDVYLRLRSRKRAPDLELEALATRQMETIRAPH